MAVRTKLIVAALLSVTLAGCSAIPVPKFLTRVETVEVEVPVYQVPEQLKRMPKLERPDLASNHLKPEDKENPGYVSKVVVESMAQLRAYAEQLETQNSTYRYVLEQEAKKTDAGKD